MKCPIGGVFAVRVSHFFLKKNHEIRLLCCWENSSFLSVTRCEHTPTRGLPPSDDAESRMLSNMARAALVWRHGGIYLDLVGEKKNFVTSGAAK